MEMLLKKRFYIQNYFLLKIILIIFQNMLVKIINYLRINPEKRLNIEETVENSLNIK